MSALPDLVRESIADFADTAAVPDGMAERALAAGEARRRRRTVLVAVAAVVAAAAVATPYAVLRADQVAPPGTADGRNAVFALHRGGAGDPKETERSGPDPEWEILDPRTGQYRRVVAGMVSMPSADLRYAIVTSLFTDADPRRIGRYDTRTGEIRWYTGPAPAVSTPQISPDGRHAAYWTDSHEGQGVAVVDLETGQVGRIRLERWRIVVDDDRVSDVWFYPPLPHEWLLADDRVTLHDTVYDLSGKRIGTLPLPADANPIAIRPGGEGALVQPGGKAETYAMADAAGAVTSQFKIALPTCRGASTDCPRPRPEFVGWRGTDELLVWPGPGDYDRPDTPIEAVDIRTGERRTIHRIGGSPSVDRLVTMPADRLPREVRHRIGF